MAEKKTKSNLGITKAPKGVAGMGKLMQQGMSATAAKNLLNKIRENKPSGRISQFDIKEALNKYKMKMPRKMPNPKTPGTRPTAPRTRKNQLERIMEKGPRPMGRPKKNPLGPLRPIRERSKTNRLIRSNTRRPKR